VGTVGVVRLAQLVVDLADHLGDDVEPSASLALLTRHAAECAGGASVGLLMRSDDGNPGGAAGSDERARAVARGQQQAREGPAVDALRTGRTDGRVELVNAVDRWPAIAPLALEAGFALVHTVVLRRGDDLLGALDVLVGRGQRVDQTQLAVVQALADLAAITLLQNLALARAERLAVQLQEALTSRIPIEQAKGALAQVHGLEPEAAFQLLRAYARRHQRNLTDVAAGWLVHPERFPGLGADPE